MEIDHIPDEQAHKKGRHRKKLLYNSILQQMEFYFSDSNLTKDRMLSQLMQEDAEGYLDVSIFLKFNRIRKLTPNIEDITKAVNKSTLIELSEDKTKIRRKEPVKIKENVDECTVYVERLKSDTTHDWLKTIFTEFGNVVYVSIPKYKHNGMIKGFAFVEFETEEEAKTAVEYFESIECKIPSHIDPQKLCSIATYEGDKKTEEHVAIKQNINGKKNDESKKNTKKRKHIEENEDTSVKSGEMNPTETNEAMEKKTKLDIEDDVSLKEINSVNEDAETVTKKQRKISKTAHDTEITEDEKEVKNKKTKIDHETEASDGAPADVMSESEGEEKKKKKQKKSHRKKINLKEIGLQILPKKDWKKMRNRYLDMQKKTMKQLKMHLNRQKFSSRYEFQKKTRYEEQQNSKVDEKEENNENKTPFQITTGIIVKIYLSEPCADNKKMKNEIKTCSSDIKYVDIPLPAGSEEVYVRFTDPKNAQTFCASNVRGKASILEGDEEKSYWEKIESCRIAKQQRTAGKHRGRDKLLKKAEKQIAKHVRFDDSE